jgi:putative NADH-flavin reductase
LFAGRALRRCLPRGDLKAMKKLCVFGASRGTGAHVVRLGRDKGFEITAVMRTPRPIHPATGINIIQGDVYDIQSVLRAIDGADAVISTIGPTKRAPSTNIYSEGVLNIAEAMREIGPGRLIAVDGLGVDPDPDLPWHYSLAMKYIARRLFGFAYSDAAEMERRLAGLDLKWTSVRVPWLSDAVARGYRSATGVRLHHGPKLGREDLAVYLLSIIDDSRTFRTWTEVAW